MAIELDMETELYIEAEAARLRVRAWHFARYRDNAPEPEPIHDVAALRAPNPIEQFPRVNAPGAGRPRSTLTAEEIVARGKAGETHAQIAAASHVGHSTIGKILRRAGLVKQYVHRVSRERNNHGQELRNRLD